MRGAEFSPPLCASMADLYSAAYYGNAEVVRELLASGADFNWRHPQGGASALYVACEFGHCDAARALIDAGAVVDFARDDGATPLSKNCQEGGHFDIVELVLHAGAKVDRFDGNGMIALWVACRRGEMALAELLLEAGASPTKKVHGWSALDLAQREVNQPLVALLSRYVGKKNGRAAAEAAAAASSAEASPSTKPPAVVRRSSPRLPPPPAPSNGADATPAARARRGGKRAAQAARAATCSRSRPSSKRSSLRCRSAPPAASRVCKELRDALQENVWRAAYVRLYGAHSARCAARRLPSPRCPAASTPPASPPARPLLRPGGRRAPEPLRESVGEKSLWRTRCAHRARAAAARLNGLCHHRNLPLKLNDSPETSPFFVCALALGTPPPSTHAPSFPLRHASSPLSPPPPRRWPLARPSRALWLGVAVGRALGPPPLARRAHRRPPGAGDRRARRRDRRPRRIRLFAHLRRTRPLARERC